MSKKSLTTGKGPGFFSELLQQGKLVFQLFLDPKVPIYLKLLPIAAVGYLLFPIDFIPDVIPGLGQIDDITILLIGAKMFIELVPNDVVDKYRQGGAPEETVDLKDAPFSGEVEESDGDDIIEGIIIEDDDEDLKES